MPKPVYELLALAPVTKVLAVAEKQNHLEQKAGKGEAT